MEELRRGKSARTEGEEKTKREKKETPPSLTPALQLVGWMMQSFSAPVLVVAAVHETVGHTEVSTLPVFFHVDRDEAASTACAPGPVLKRT